METFDTCQDLVAWAEELRAERRYDAIARFFGPIQPHVLAELSAAPDTRRLLDEVPGVAEADRIVAFGAHAAVADGPTLRILDGRTGAERAVRDFEAPISGLLVDGDHLVVLAAGSDGVTASTLRDGPDLAVVREVYLSGDLAAARLIRGTLVVITRGRTHGARLTDLLPTISVDGGFLGADCAGVVGLPGHGDLTRTTVTTMPTLRGTPRSTTVIGPVQLTTVAADAVWLGQVGRSTTRAFRIALSEDRTWTSGEIPGRVLGSSAWSERDGVLRVVSTDGGQLGARVSTHRIAEGLPLIQATPVLAPGETLTAARFAGDLAWASTVLIRKDPLFAVDVADPQNPTVLAALDVPGITHDLLPIDGGERLIALGTDVVEGRERPVVSLFATEDPAQARLVNRVALPGADAAARTDHRAFGWDPASGLLAVPTRGASGNGAQILRVYADALVPEAFVPLASRPDRALILHDRWWFSDASSWSSAPIRSVDDAPSIPTPGAPPTIPAMQAGR